MAEARGVAGSVANRADGAVEAVFEGEPAAVQQLVDFCRRGPEGAAVDQVEVADEEPAGDAGFRIR
jgi:acylphosphatase